MIRLNILILFLFVSSLIFSQKLAFDQGKINQKNYYEEISFELVNDKIMLPVVINNKTFTFLLDTGAPNLISKRVLEEINVQNTKKINVSDANNQSDEMEMVAIESMKLGNLSFENNVALVSDLDNHFILKCFKMDGFIGSNLLRNSVIKISLKDKRIIITDDIKNLKTKSKPSKLKLFGEQKSPYVKINFSKDGKKDVTEEVLIDTGMDGFYEMSNRAFGILSTENVWEELSRSTGSSSIGLFGTAPLKEQVLLKAPFFEINNTRFENLITNTTDDNNSRLGLDLLKHGDIIIDFKKKKFYFEAVENIVLDKKPPIYSATIIDHKYSVGFVWDVTLRDKMNYGDEIIRVDSFVIEEMDFCDIVKIKNFRKDNQAYEIEVKSKDKTETNILLIEQ
ncbi:retroviral-like aspartic protease family protein [Flavobacterium azooxidireducens]|uniref:Retroviral-like aspartic protease family protein n=1 Tax=Flavobacterium azooxidireducens TaxID=1871076 RepID=A0ABY4KCW9_9FLAO|nr:retropepsin-like aspartic protease [Flavobacterium azooxidireducens]UPQ78635.1 retroviral-like aspartic protease family protein [Flavobacterium azooxidireducens]